MEDSFLDVKIEQIGKKKDTFTRKLKQLALSNAEILQNLIYYFDNIFRTAMLKTTDSHLHTNRDFALELFAKIFSDLVHGATGLYITKTDFLMFITGIIDAPTSTSPVAKTITLCAKENDTIFITGKTGTGKELHAKVIHYLSSKSKEKFMAINCAGIPDALLESELFGIEENTATGVGPKEGILNTVGEGTLFLDEIGDMPLALQAKVLRVLQSRQFYKVGDPKTIYHFKGRVIAATNRDINNEIEISPHTFRPDLFYRLNVLPIRLPSFKELSDEERESAILKKLRHIIYEKSKQPGNDHILYHLSGEGPTYRAEYDDEGVIIGAVAVKEDNEFISFEALQYLLNYNYPGNYRELDNIIRRAYVLSDRKRIEVSALPEEIIHYNKGEADQEEINTNDVDKVFLKDIIEHAQMIKIDIVRRKMESIYSKGQALKTVLRNEGIKKESDYQNIRKKIEGIIGKKEMSRIIKGNG